MFLKNLKRVIFYSYYPSKIWSFEIYTALKKLNILNGDIIDAPCGSGIIIYWLLKKKCLAKFNLIDISNENIQLAKEFLNNCVFPNQLDIQQENLYNLKEIKSNDTWLLINSLYLLPDLGKLMSIIKNRAEYLLGIFPYLDKKNYECYKSKFSSENININGMSAAETLNFFKLNGYNLIEKKDIIHIPFYCYFSKKRLVNFFLSQFFFLLEKIYKKDSYYWMGVFKRE